MRWGEFDRRAWELSLRLSPPHLVARHGIALLTGYKFRPSHVYQLQKMFSLVGSARMAYLASKAGYSPEKLTGLIKERASSMHGNVGKGRIPGRVFDSVIGTLKRFANRRNEAALGKRIATTKRPGPGQPATGNSERTRTPDIPAGKITPIVGSSTRPKSARAASRPTQKTARRREQQRANRRGNAAGIKPEPKKPSNGAHPEYKAVLSKHGVTTPYHQALASEAIGWMLHRHKVFPGAHAQPNTIAKEVMAKFAVMPKSKRPFSVPKIHPDHALKVVNHLISHTQPPVLLESEGTGGAYFLNPHHELARLHPAYEHLPQHLQRK